MGNYSYKKGFGKGLIAFATSALGATTLLIVFAGLTDATIWSLLETYLKPVLGTLTVGGVAAFATKWLKQRAKKD